MPTTHFLLAMAAHAAAEVPATGLSGGAAPAAGRTRWTVAVRVARLEAGGSVTLALEGSATGADDSWATLLALPAITEASSVTKSSAGDAPDFTVQPWHHFLRARATAQTGAATYEVEATAPFVDATADQARFSKEIRTFEGGFARLLVEAEDDVLSMLTRARRAGTALSGVFPTSSQLGGGALPLDLGVSLPGAPWQAPDPFHPPVVGPTDTPLGLAMSEAAADRIDAIALDIDLTQPGVGDALKKCIVRQAHHRFERFRLARDASPSALVTSREMGELAPGMDRILAPFRPRRSTGVWRGR